jgi:hypothetical protein
LHLNNLVDEMVGVIALVGDWRSLAEDRRSAHVRRRCRCVAPGLR